MNGKKIIAIAAIFGALAVMLGAFGAHTLREVLEDRQIEIYHTAVHYQFYHTFALGMTGLLVLYFKSEKFFNTAAWMFIFGILFFSGSLYILALRDVLQLGWLASILGPATPIGGILFIIGWIFVGIGTIKSKPIESSDSY